MPETAQCRHHWLLPEPSSEYITGTCVFCNAEKQFLAWPSADTLRDAGIVSGRPGRKKELSASYESIDKDNAGA